MVDLPGAQSVCKQIAKQRVQAAKHCKSRQTGLQKEGRSCYLHLLEPADRLSDSPHLSQSLPGPLSADNVVTARAIPRFGDWKIAERLQDDGACKPLRESTSCPISSSSSVPVPTAHQSRHLGFVRKAWALQKTCEVDAGRSQALVYLLHSVSSSPASRHDVPSYSQVSECRSYWSGLGCSILLCQKPRRLSMPFFHATEALSTSICRC